MKWFNRHLNWTYTIALTISIILPILSILDVTGTIILSIGIGLFFILNLGIGAWVLTKKGQSLVFMFFAFFFIAFVVLILVLANKKVAKRDEISEADYYEDREASIK
jgi:hypothetical protein